MGWGVVLRVSMPSLDMLPSQNISMFTNLETLPVSLRVFITLSLALLPSPEGWGWKASPSNKAFGLSVSSPILNSPEVHFLRSKDISIRKFQGFWELCTRNSSQRPNINFALYDLSNQKIYIDNILDLSRSNSQCFQQLLYTVSIT